MRSGGPWGTVMEYDPEVAEVGQGPVLTLISAKA